MIHNEFESAIRTEGRPDDLCEFMDCVDVAENSCESVSKVSNAWHLYLHQHLAATCIHPNRVSIGSKHQDSNVP
jgi:hypothetical protein